MPQQQHHAALAPPWQAMPPQQPTWQPAPAALQPQPRWGAAAPAPLQAAPPAPPPLGLPGLAFSPGVWGAVGSGSGGGEARLGNGAFASATWGATGLPGLASPALWAAMERGSSGPAPTAPPPPLCASPPPQVLDVELLLAGDADFAAVPQQAQPQRSLPALSIWH